MNQLPEPVNYWHNLRFLLLHSCEALGPPPSLAQYSLFLAHSFDLIFVDFVEWHLPVFIGKTQRAGHSG